MFLNLTQNKYINPFFLFYFVKVPLKVVTATLNKNYFYREDKPEKQHHETRLTPLIKRVNVSHFMWVLYLYGCSLSIVKT